MFDSRCNFGTVTLLGAATILNVTMFSASERAESAPMQSEAEVEVAYCNTDDFAIKIYQLEGFDSESERNGTFIRIYDRADNISFINGTLVSRETVVKNGISGTAYENLRGENQWELFISENPGEGFDPESPNADPDVGIHQCILSRDGEVMDYGEGRISERVGAFRSYLGIKAAARLSLATLSSLPPNALVPSQIQINWVVNR